MRCLIASDFTTSFTRPKTGIQVLNPISLARSEFILAYIISVVHIVMDGITSRTIRTSIGTRRATGCKIKLLRSIGDQITIARAGGALESVEQSKPVTDFMDCSNSHVVSFRLGTW